MSIEGLGSPFSQGINGITGVAARTEEERRQSRKNSAFEDNAARDPRASFTADIESMLNDASGVRSSSQQAAQTGQLVPASRKIADADSVVSDTGDSFVRSSGLNDDPGTYTARGLLKTQTAAVTTGAVATGSTLASEPSVVPAGTETGSSKEKDEPGAKTAGELSAEEEKQVEKLRQRDQEVRAHEQAHQATGGEHAGGASYTYQRGPDNRQYAIGGSVPIDVSPIPDDPDATVAKAEKVRAAAMAPASPSGADQQVAAKASQMASKARAEQSEKSLNPEKDDESGAIGQSDKASDTVGQPDKAGQADKSNATVASDPSEKSDEADASSVASTEKAAESGLIAQVTQASQTTSATGDAPTDTAAETVSGISAASSLNAANPLKLGPPRPAESNAAMSGSRSDPRSDAAPAQSSAYAALQQLGQVAAEMAGRADSSSSRTSADPRAMSRATAAYSRVRGETGLAPANTGISMSV